MKEKWVVDRIEEDKIVLQNEKQQVKIILKSQIQASVKEKDVLFQEKDNYYLDEMATKDQKQKIEDMVKDLWEN